MFSAGHNSAPTTAELTRAGTDLYYAVQALMGRGEIPSEVQDALIGWRKLMERNHETH